MTKAPTSRTTTAERVRAGAVVVPSMGAAREAGTHRPLAASGSLALLALLALLGGLMQPSSVATQVRRMGGLEGITTV